MKFVIVGRQRGRGRRPQQPRFLLLLTILALAKVALGQDDYGNYEYEDTPFFIEEPQNVTTRIDEKVILKCRIGNTKGKSAQWTRNGFGLGQDRALSEWDNLRMMGRDRNSKTSKISFFYFLPFLKTGNLANVTTICPARLSST